ncbi:unnamed protein product [Peniophora sp. CBMAI 1063]|nr:unnamed protein product [Peniophora sp. CBMAI 1063]
MAKTGTWDGTEAGAIGAVQFVDIGPGKLAAPFRAQADTLYEVEQFIIATIRGGGLPVHLQDVMKRRRREGLHLVSRVFTKVGPNTPAAIISTGAASQIIKKWRIIDSVRLGQRGEDNVVRNTCAATFSPGDFVQATIKFDVESVQSSSRHEPPVVRIRHHLKSLVQLVSARDVPRVLQVSPSSGSGKPQTAEFVAEEGIDRGYEFSML